MDQEIPQSELPQRPNRLRFRVGKSHLPGSDGYKGSVADQRTLSIDDIAARVVRKRTEYRQATLVSTFNLLKEEIYLALGEGLNVDFGFGRTELTLRGAFEQPYEAFDPERHAFAPRLRPSPQLRQRVAHLKGENDTHRLERDSMPLPSYVSLGYKPREAGSTELYAVLSSLRSKGTVDTGTHRMFSSEQLGRRFLYDASTIEGNIVEKVVEDVGGADVPVVLLYPLEGEDLVCIEVQDVDAYAETAEERREP